MPEKKTLDQIVNDTLNSSFGISDSDLQALFEDTAAPAAPVTPTAPAAPTVEPVNPSPAVATPVAIPASVTPPVVTPEPSQAGNTPNKSADLESSLKTANDQISHLNTIVQELLRKSQTPVAAPTAPTPTNPLDDVDDQAIIERPKESILKIIPPVVHAIMKQVLPQAFAEYDNNRSVNDAIAKFRSDHSDFDELRPIMRQIVSENTAVNDNVASLPRVYEEAKARKAKVLENMKKELNISPPSNPAPASTLSEEEILAKLEQRIAEKIRKRRSLSGTLTSAQTTPVSPADRQTPSATDKPMTDEEKMFDEMMKSGPPSANFLQGLELASRK